MTIYQWEKLPDVVIDEEDGYLIPKPADAL